MSIQNAKNKPTQSHKLICKTECTNFLKMGHCHEEATHKKVPMNAVCKSCSVMSDSLPLHGLYYTVLSSPWNSPGWNTGVGSLSLLQGIFPTWGSNPGLLHCSQILYHLSHKGSLMNVEGCPNSQLL